VSIRVTTLSNGASYLKYLRSNTRARPQLGDGADLRGVPAQSPASDRLGSNTAVTPTGGTMPTPPSPTRLGCGSTSAREGPRLPRTLLTTRGDSYVVKLLVVAGVALELCLISCLLIVLLARCRPPDGAADLAPLA